MASARGQGATRAGLYCTSACSLERLTVASTPGSALSAFSTRPAQVAQVIPSTGRTMCESSATAASAMLMAFSFRCASDWPCAISGGLHRRDKVFRVRIAYDRGAAVAEIHIGVPNARTSAQDTHDRVGAPAANHSRDRERDSTCLVRCVPIHGFLLLPAYWNEDMVSPYW